MRAVTLVVALFLAGFSGFDRSSVVAGQAGGAWKTILDGKSLNGWTPIGNANWKIADGAVEATMGNGFLVSNESYGDVEVRTEFWASEDGNSGIFIRCSNPNEINLMNAYEINIYDKRPDQTYRTGGIVDVAKPMAMENAANKWNTMIITAKGPRLTVNLNGKPMVDVHHSAQTRGRIALQYGAGTIKFRKVEVR